MFDGQRTQLDILAFRWKPVPVGQQMLTSDLITRLASQKDFYRKAKLFPSNFIFFGAVKFDAKFYNSNYLLEAQKILITGSAFHNISQNQTSTKFEGATGTKFQFVHEHIYVELQDQQHEWMYFFQVWRKSSCEFFFGSGSHNYVQTRSLGAPPGPNFQLQALRAS